MKLIELVIELGDHLLDAACFLFLVQLVVDGVLDVFVGVLTLGFLGGVGLVLEDFADLGGGVLLQEN